jgi:hypothetical protein
MAILDFYYHNGMALIRSAVLAIVVWRVKQRSKIIIYLVYSVNYPRVLFIKHSLTNNSLVRVKVKVL